MTRFFSWDHQIWNFIFNVAKLHEIACRMNWFCWERIAYFVCCIVSRFSPYGAYNLSAPNELIIIYAIIIFINLKALIIEFRCIVSTKKYILQHPGLPIEFLEISKCQVKLCVFIFPHFPFNHPFFHFVKIMSSSYVSRQWLLRCGCGHCEWIWSCLWRGNLRDLCVILACLGFAPNPFKI